MADTKSLSQLTRSLMIGASVGTVTLAQVGCTPEQLAELNGTAPAYGGQAGPATAAPAQSAGERQMCEQALRTKSASDTNALMTRYPGSRCIAPLLGALPASTLAALSPSALTGLSRSVRRSIPANIVRSLPPAYQASLLQPRESGRDGGSSY